MNARAIQWQLMRNRYQRSMVMPNFTPRGWWECDVFELTKAGFFREYEIKLTRSDFHADARKGQVTFGGSWPATTKTILHKHSQLAARHVKGPSRFYFVCPIDLIKLEEVPEWAGLITVKPCEWRQLSLVTVKEAPQLHRCKADPAMQQYAEKVSYYRFILQWLRKS